MKNVLFCTFLLSALACTGKSTNKPVSTEEAAKAVPLIHLDRDSIGLDIRLSQSFKIQTVDGQAAIFRMECEDSNCGTAIVLEEDGTLKWTPSLYKGATPATIPITIKVAHSSESVQGVEGKVLALELGKNLYLAGDSWGSPRVNEVNSNFKNIIGLDSDLNGYRGATVFYLGTVDGEDLVATARHVLYAQKLGNEPKCNSSRVFRFESLNLEASCKRIIWTSEANDFAIVAVESRGGGDLSALRASKVCSSNDPNLAIGHQAVIGGYGVFNNPYKALVFSSDNDCRFLPLTKQSFAMRRDGGEKYEVSFPVIACDTSPGYSGAPMFDQSSGRLLGVLLGANDHQTKVPSSDDIQAFIASKSEDTKLIGNSSYVTLSDAFNEIRASLNSEQSEESLLTDILKSLDGKSCKM